MNKHTRSRILALGIAGALLAGGSLPLIPLAIAGVTNQSASAALLARGQRLYHEKQFSTSKQVLLSIDPAKLSATERTTLATLLLRVDEALAGARENSRIFRNAQTALRDGHLAHAVRLYRLILADPNIPPVLRREADDNLALARAKQKALVPAMEALLQKAAAAYKAGHFDQAEADLYTIQVTGSDLGSHNALIPQYQNLIAQKRAAAVEAIEQARLEKIAAARRAAQLAAAQKAHAAQLVAEKKAAAQKAAQFAAAQRASQLAAAQKAHAAQLIAEKKAAAQRAAQLAAAKKAAAQRAAQLAAAKKAAAEKLAAAKIAAHEKAVESQLLAEQRTQEMQAEKQRLARAAQLAAAQKAAAAKLLAAQLAARKQAQAAQAAAARQSESARLAAQQKAEAAALAAREAAEKKAVAAKPVVSPPPTPVAVAAAPPVPSTPRPTVVPATQAAAATAKTAVSSPPAPVAVAAATPKPPASRPATVPAAPAAPAAATTHPVTLSRAQLNIQRSAALSVLADKAVHAARYHRAIALYSDALALNPRNQAASLGLKNAQKFAAGHAPGLLAQTLYNQAIEAQRVVVLFNDDMRLSTQAMEKDDFVTATDRANNALASIAAARRLFPRLQYKTMKARARQQLAMVQQRSAAAQAKQQALRQKEIQQSQLQLEHHLALERRHQVNQLLGQANEYLKRMQYAQALDTLNQVVAIAPTNNSARFMRRMVKDQIEYNKWNKYHNEQSRNLQMQEVETERALIPYRNLLVYPSDWPELSRMRMAERRSTRSPVNRLIRHRLAASVPSIIVHNQPFSGVVGLLRNETGTNIVVNWNALAAAGVSKQTPISLSLRNVPFKKVLSIVLQQAQGGGGSRLGYSISEGVLTISTRAQLAQQQVVKVYDIHDLLVQAPNFSNAPSFNLQSATQNTSSSVSSQGGGGAMGAAGGGLFTGSASTTSQAGQSAKLIKSITKLITSTVDPASWTVNGGTIGSISELNGQFVVNQTPNNQTKIYNLLQQLREARAIEISITTRFLVVDTSFLNDFGFSWSLGFPSVVVNNPPGSSAAQSAYGSMFGNGIGPLTVTNGTNSMTVPTPTGVGNNIAKNFSPSSALSVSGSILSNYQLSLLLNAAQESEHTTNLEAPRITLYNGQRAWIAVTNQLNFISSVTQNITGSGLGGIPFITTTLNTSTLSTGIVLNVQATVSANHRYVEMTVQPSLSTLTSLTLFSIAGQAISGSTTQAISGGFVQLPAIQTTTVATTVSVPDGGTLLLGGERLSGEEEIEAGVPILSQIPIINRLFTNRSYVRDNGILLILIRPRIIIQKEWEKKQFGRNY